MTQRTNLDGVWYDSDSGQYCRIIERDSTIGLTPPDSDKVYYEFESYDEFESSRDDFYSLPENVVDNPKSAYLEFVTMMFEGKTLDAHEEIVFLYAEQQIDIVEKEKS